MCVECVKWSIRKGITLRNVIYFDKWGRYGKEHSSIQQLFCGRFNTYDVKMFNSNRRGLRITRFFDRIAQGPYETNMRKEWVDKTRRRFWRFLEFLNLINYISKSTKFETLSYRKIADLQEILYSFKYVFPRDLLNVPVKSDWKNQ